MNLKSKLITWASLIAILMIALNWGSITAGAVVGLTIIGNVLFWMFVAGCIATALALIVSFSKQRRQRSASLDHNQNRDEEQHATAPIPVHTLRLRDQGQRDVSAVPELDAFNVYQMAAWQKRKQAEAVGRESPPASS